MRNLELSIGRFENFVISSERIFVKNLFSLSILKIATLGVALTMLTILAFDFLLPNHSPNSSINGFIINDTSIIEKDTTPNLSYNNTSTFVRKEFTDKRDQQNYPMVKINNRWWMGKNLNFETSESNCYKDQNQCSELGRLYNWEDAKTCLLYTSPSPRDRTRSRMPSSA